MHAGGRRFEPAHLHPHQDRGGSGTEFIDKRIGRERKGPDPRGDSRVGRERRKCVGARANDAIQVIKGRRWMPRQQEAMKDVASCEKLRGAAHRR